VAALRAVCLARDYEGGVDAPQYGKADGETNDSQHDPMRCHPKDELDVVVVPAVTQVVGKEAPFVVVVFIGK